MKFDDKNFIAAQVKYYRKRSNLTQSELAEKIDISVQHVSRIESGRYIPSLKTFFMIVEALNIDLRVFGFKALVNSKKEELIQTILNADDTELTLYKDILCAINKSLNKTKH